MINLQDYIGNSKLFRKFTVDNLLFTEFKCPIEGKDSIWWHNNFFAYIVSGETQLQMPQNKYKLKAGDCAFARKGSVITYGQSHKDFCELLVFVPDDFIRTVIQKYKVSLASPISGKENDTVVPLSNDDVLTTYFHSLLTYFRQSNSPSETLLRLKFEELIISLITNHRHLTLNDCFHEICTSSRPSVKAIMEANFPRQLSLNEFAKLCARSLSAFKSEFKSLYHTTPGKWLQQKRVEYSHYLLETTDESIDEIAYSSGFKNRSHFIRVFKNKYYQTPGKYRMQRNISERKDT